MKVVAPIEIGQATITSYNVAASPNAPWVSTKTYGVGEKVVVGQYDFESLVAGNVGNDPTTDGGVKWLRLNPSNRWAMFNKKKGNVWLVGTKTTNPDTIDITFAPGRVINSIGMVGVVADKVTVQMIVGGSVVYTRELIMSSKTAVDWYDYYYGDFVTRDNLAYTDLPAYAGASVRVIVDNTGEVAEVGMMVVGQQASIGWAVWGTSSGFENYSLTKIDDFGEITQTPRGLRDLVDFDCRNYKNQNGNMNRILKPLKDSAALYIGSEDIDSTIIIGKLEDFKMTFANVALVEYSLSVLSLA